MSVAQGSAAAEPAAPATAADWSFLPGCGQRAMHFINAGYRVRALRPSLASWFEPVDDLKQGTRSRSLAAFMWAAWPWAGIGVDAGGGGLLAIRSEHPALWDQFCDGRGVSGPVVDCGAGLELRLFRQPDLLEGLRTGELMGDDLVVIGEGDVIPLPPTVRRIIHYRAGAPSSIDRAPLSMSVREPLVEPPAWLIEELEAVRARQRHQEADARAAARRAALAPSPAASDATSPASATPPDPERARRYAESALKGELGRLSAAGGMPSFTAAAERLGAFVGARLLEEAVVLRRLTTRGVSLGIGERSSVEATATAAIERGRGMAPELLQRLSQSPGRGKGFHGRASS